MKPKDITHIVLHHALHGYRDDDGIGHNYDTSMKDIRRWHTSPPRNWRKEGYHGLVRLSGKFEKGRRENERGAHSAPQGKYSNINGYSLGLVTAGNADYAEWTEKQKITIIKKLAEWCLKYNIPVENVLGHRELGSKKTCPGTLINMDNVRTEVYKLVHVDTQAKLPPRLKAIVGFGFRLLYMGFKLYPNTIQNRLNRLRHQSYFNQTLGE